MTVPGLLYCAREFECDALSPPELKAYSTPLAAFIAEFDRIAAKLEYRSIEVRGDRITITTQTDKWRFNGLTIYEINPGPTSVWVRDKDGWSTPHAVHAFAKVTWMSVEDYVTNVNTKVDDAA